MPPGNTNLKELIRLTKENNRMLHKMRRNAFWGGVIKFVLYVGIFIAAPLWIYATYLAPITEQVLNTYGQIQGTSAQVQAQFGGLQDLLEQFQGQFSSQE